MDLGMKLLPALAVDAVGILHFNLRGGAANV